MLLYMNKGKVICRLSHVLCPFHYPNHGRFMLFFSKFTDAFGAAEHLNNKHFMCMIIPILDLKGCACGIAACRSCQSHVPQGGKQTFRICC